MKARTILTKGLSIRNCLRLLLLLLLAGGLVAPNVFAEDSESPQPTRQPEQLTLSKTAMCEDIREYAPFNSSVVFSVERGSVSCFTEFDPVPEKTVIYHTWRHKDQASTKKRLTLKPPRWATFSSIQLRETDKGPWRVEISDSDGRIFQTLRFSVTD